MAEAPKRSVERLGIVCTTRQHARQHTHRPSKEPTSNAPQDPPASKMDRARIQDKQRVVSLRATEPVEGEHDQSQKEQQQDDLCLQVHAEQQAGPADGEGIERAGGNDAMRCGASRVSDTAVVLAGAGWLI